MKTANVYDIERALQQPITPEQRQTAAANNPVAALIAQRLDGVEGSLRQKLQTPPPPQGTVMNQYYQWPQQQPEMGLAQPGLEQMAQQYAAGGLVAFADGGPVYDYDGGDAYGAYAEGGLATMLPMGYAGEDDVPVFNTYAGGGDVLKSVMPYTTGYGEMDDDELDDMIAAEIEAETTGVPQVEEPYNAGPGDIVGVGLEGLRKVGSGIKALGSGLADKAFIKDPAWEARKDPTERAKQEYEAIHGPVPDPNKPKEPSFADKAGRVVNALSSLIGGSTESGEDIKYKQQQEDNSQKAAAHYDSLDKPVKARKASVSVPSANPVRTVSAPAPQAGTPGLEPIPAEEERRRVMDQIRAEGYEEPNQPTTPTQSPEQRAVAQQVVNSKLTADQQIAALAKYFQTDTSEAMRIKGEMEKENAHAGNVGIMAVLANALGMGLGTYGTGAARWGAGLMGAAQGFMSEEERAQKRQAALNELSMKIKGMEGEGTRKAAETVLKKREAADERKQKLEDQLALEQVKGGYREKVANIGAGASMRNKDVDVANRSAGGLDQAKYAHILAEAEKGAADYIKANYTDQGKPTPPGIYDQVRQRLIQERLGQVGSVPQAPAGMGVTPDLVVGPRTSRGMFDPNRGFTAYQ